MERILTSYNLNIDLKIINKIFSNNKQLLQQKLRRFNKKKLYNSGIILNKIHKRQTKWQR